MIVKKAYNMAEMMKIPVLGIVENYSYVKCPDCGKELKIFGESHIEEIAAELNVPVVGKMPIDMEYASKADNVPSTRSITNILQSSRSNARIKPQTRKSRQLWNHKFPDCRDFFTL